MKKEQNEITLKGLINIFLPKWWIILIVSLVASIFLGGFSMIKNDTYTSSAKYMMSKVSSSSPDDALTGLNSSEADAMRIMIANLNELINTSNFAIEVNNKLKAEGINSYTESEIMKMMSVTLAGTDTTCYNFSVISEDPVHAYRIADIAGELLVDEFDAKTMYAVTINIIDDADTPTSPNSKNVARNAVIGFAGGLLLSLVLIFVMSRFDVIIRSREKIEECFDLPILGVIPRRENES